MRWLLQSDLVTYYGNVFVLLILCAYYSVATLTDYHPKDAATARRLAAFVIRQAGPSTVLIITPGGAQNAEFAEAIHKELAGSRARLLATVQGRPRDAAAELARLGEQQVPVEWIITQDAAARWPVLTDAGLAKLAADFPSLAEAKVIKPASYRWPVFLTRDNLRSIVNNISIVAIIAIGMTMVIITAGIDLSVGSLIAFAGVSVAVLLSRWTASEAPSLAALAFSCVSAILLCGLFGLFSGIMVTAFEIPAFIVTLAVMQMARGVAFKVAGGPSPIEINSEAFHWLGGGAWGGIPVPVLVMALLYLVAHLVMAHTALGRYIYAVGGNPEAARLSGVPVKRVLLLTYVVCGALAGVAGVLDAALFRVGRAVAGMGYELQIIAAVVVGGTSLAGGEGKVLGTLIGALILGVIQNGMNLTNIDSFTQMIVFGTLIVIAVLLDRLKMRHWRVSFAARQ